MYKDLTLENKIIKIINDTILLIKDLKFEITEKGNSSNIVTSSDLKAQEYLVEKLGHLIPDSGFYCEENDLQDLTKEYVWIIDPIDGTTNYSRGINECAISVGLLHNGVGVVGVVSNIYLDEVFSATINLGARLNGKPISVSNRSFNQGLLCTAMCVYKKDLAKICSDIIFDAYIECNDYRRFGSCAIELCYLACGRCDLYFEIRVFPWDYTGAYIILKEAGGILMGYDSSKLTFDKTTPLIGANNLENFNKLNEIVLKYLSKGDLDYE